MIFWDASAVLPLVVREKSSASLIRLASRERGHAAWWATAVECDSAICRLERENRLSPGDARRVGEAVSRLLDSWAAVEPSSAVRTAARRLLRIHPLRAGDALQLAAAVTAAEGRPEGVTFVGLDERLRDAAAREGFRVLPVPKRDGSRARSLV